AGRRAGAVRDRLPAPRRDLPRSGGGHGRPHRPLRAHQGARAARQRRALLRTDIGRSMPRLDLRDLADRRARSVMCGAMAAQMIMGLTYGGAPLLRPMLDELGWSRGALMAASSPTTWMTALASPVAGYLTQRYGARAVIAVGALLAALIGWGHSQ